MRKQKINRKVVSTSLLANDKVFMKKRFLLLSWLYLFVFAQMSLGAICDNHSISTSGNFVLPTSNDETAITISYSVDENYLWGGQIQEQKNDGDWITIAGNDDPYGIGADIGIDLLRSTDNWQFASKIIQRGVGRYRYRYRYQCFAGLDPIGLIPVGYSTDWIYSPIINGIENTLPTVSITSPTLNETFTPDTPGGITIKAKALDNTGGVKQVVFYYIIDDNDDWLDPDDEKRPIATVVTPDSQGVYTTTLVNPSSGWPLTLYVDAYDNVGSNLKTTALQKIEVNTPPDNFELEEPAGDLSFRIGTEISLKATVDDSEEFGVMPGKVENVTFYRLDNGQPKQIGYSTNNGDNVFEATWKSDVKAIDLEIFAIAEDNLGATTQSSSSDIDITENAAPTVGLDATATSLDAGQSVTFTAEPNDDDGNDSITKVEFYRNDALMDTVTASPYVYTWNASPNTWNFVAKVYDDEGGVGSSGIVSVTVNTILPPDTPPHSITIDPSDNPNYTGYYTVAWTTINGANSYKLEENAGSGWVELQNSELTSKYFPGKGSGNYSYRVYACNENGCSDNPTAAVSLTVDLSAPATPQDFVNKPDSNTGDYTLQWPAVSGQPLPTFYRLEEKLGTLDTPDSTSPWLEVTLSDPMATQHSYIAKGKGKYSYQVTACRAVDNIEKCSLPGPQWTVEVLPPLLYGASLSCDSSCISASGIGLDPNATVSVRAIHNSAIESSFSGGSISWDSDNQLNITIGDNTPIHDALFNLGVRVEVTNPNGDSGAIEVYGDHQTAYISLTDSAPTIGKDENDQDVLYVAVGELLYALDPSDGSLQIKDGWPFVTGGDIKSTPAINANDGTVYVGSMDDNLYAIEPIGQWKWTVETDGDVISSPILDESSTIYFGSMDGILYAVYPENGAIKWEFPAGGGGIADTPVLAGDGTIYVTTVDGQVHAIGRGILGPDVLVWENVDDSLLEDDIDETSWEPGSEEIPYFLRVARLYRALLQPELSLNREVLTFWTYALYNKASIEEVAAAFLGSDTGKDNFPLSMSNSAFLDELYQRVYPNQLQPDINYGGNYYSYNDLLTLLNDGTSRAAIAVIFSDSADYAADVDGNLLIAYDYLYDENFDWTANGCTESTCDSDNDGLPDWWEELYFGPDLTAQSGTTDADGAGWDANGDGVVNNLDAYASREDPCAAMCTDIETPPAPHSQLPPSSDIAASDAVGATPGSFRVDESGSATYTMPIAVAPGVAGVTPQISLSYSSQAGNGLVGQGWSVGGLSAITRCRQTLAVDGIAKPITWTSEDRFCLDGQRLILEDGSYGDSGSTYRTEIDSFAEITYQAGDYFEVKRKDGSTSYYGHDDDDFSKVAGGNGTTLSWALSRFEDSVDNPIVYHYTNDTEGLRIANIQYAFGAQTDAGAQIIFNYDDRTNLDPIQGYTAGELYTTNKRLSSIKVKSKSVVIDSAGTDSETDQTIRTYNLHYKDLTEANPISKLDWVQESANGVTLPKTTFGWSEPFMGYENRVSFMLNADDDDGVYQYKQGDVNGDGKMDLVWIEWDVDGDGTDQRLKYAISDGEELTLAEFASSNGDDESCSNLKCQNFDQDVNSVSPTIVLELIDYNADGRQDAIIYAGGEWKVYLSKPQADGSWKLDVPDSQNGLDDTGLTERETQFVDINSDGLVDAVYVAPHPDTGEDTVYRRLLTVNDPTATSSSRYYHFAPEQEMVLDIALPQADYSFPTLPEEPEPQEGDTGYPSAEWVEYRKDYPKYGKAGYSADSTVTNELKLVSTQTADFNGDGRVDLLLANETARCVEESWNDGDDDSGHTRKCKVAYSYATYTQANDDQLVKYESPVNTDATDPEVWPTWYAPDITGWHDLLVTQPLAVRTGDLNADGLTGTTLQTGRPKCGDADEIHNAESRTRRVADRPARGSHRRTDRDVLELLLRRRRQWSDPGKAGNPNR